MPRFEQIQPKRSKRAVENVATFPEDMTQAMGGSPDPETDEILESIELVLKNQEPLSEAIKRALGQATQGMEVA